MDPPGNQAGYPMQQNTPLQNRSFTDNSFQPNDRAVRHGYSAHVATDSTTGQAQFKDNLRHNSGSLICPYTPCARSKKSPFKTAETLFTHIQKFHAEEVQKELDATKTFNKAGPEAVMGSGGVPSNHQHGATFTDGNVEEELRDLIAEQLNLKERLRVTGIQNKILMEQINQLERQQYDQPTVPASQQTTLPWQGNQGNQGHLRPFNSQAPPPGWPLTSQGLQPRHSHGPTGQPIQTHNNPGYNPPYVPRQAYPEPFGFTYHQPVHSTGSGASVQPIPSYPSRFGQSPYGMERHFPRRESPEKKRQREQPGSYEETIGGHQMF